MSLRRLFNIIGITCFLLIISCINKTSDSEANSSSSAEEMSSEVEESSSSEMYSSFLSSSEENRESSSEKISSSDNISSSEEFSSSSILSSSANSSSSENISSSSDELSSTESSSSRISSSSEDYSSSSESSSSEASSSSIEESSSSNDGIIKSTGCGLELPDSISIGRNNIYFDAGSEGDGERDYIIDIPDGYNPENPYRVIFAFPGRDWKGHDAYINDYFHLNTQRNANEILVYGSALLRDFPGWGESIGWLLGPYAGNAIGVEDFNYLYQVADQIKEQYCIDETKIMATGHSWGGDMAMVAGCFMRDLFTAVAPTAANDPYWFRNGSKTMNCTTDPETQPGETAMWIWYSDTDDAFNDGGANGRAQLDFWISELNCSDQYTDLELGTPGQDDCREYQDCDQPLRYCNYIGNHQISRVSYFTSSILEWFRSF